jgi:two-component system OmpR family response regulator
VAHRILVVEDDPHIREIIRFALTRAGMEAIEARDGVEALNKAAVASPDLIVLDIGLPEMDGLEVCRRIRRKEETPILFLSARDEEIDRILGLELGADDYVSKPFSPRELVARVNAILKRARAAPSPEPAMLSRGDLALSPEAHEARFGADDLGLTALEFAIVKTLLARPQMVFSREKILDAAYPGTVHVADRTIDSHIRNIRAKFFTLGCESAVETVHGVGFRIGRCERAT